MTLKIDAVTAVLERVVAEKGEDYLYKTTEVGRGAASCAYSNPDATPSCIVGHVLAELEPEAFAALVAREHETSCGTTSVTEIFTERWETTEEHADTTTDGWYADSDPAHSPIPVKDDRIILGLGVAQELQDGGYPWGVALAGYKAALEYEGPLYHSWAARQKLVQQARQQYLDSRSDINTGGN